MPAPAVTAGDVEMMMHAAQDSLAEVQMGQLAMTRATSDGVRQLAQRLITDHSTANAQLAVLAQQQGIALPQSVDPQHAAAVQRLSALTGPRFDVAFLEQMIADHAKGVAMYERIANTAAHPSLRGWAAQQVPVLRQHHAMTQGLHSSMARAGGLVVPSASPITYPR
jgi:putative membrane protein